MNYFHFLKAGISDYVMYEETFFVREILRGGGGGGCIEGSKLSF